MAAVAGLTEAGLFDRAARLLAKRSGTLKTAEPAAGAALLLHVHADHQRCGADYLCAADAADAGRGRGALPDLYRGDGDDRRKSSGAC